MRIEGPSILVPKKGYEGENELNDIENFLNFGLSQIMLLRTSEKRDVLFPQKIQIIIDVRCLWARFR